MELLQPSAKHSDCRCHIDADFLASAINTFTNSSYEMLPELVRLTVRIICRISSSVKAELGC